jgi:Glyoxalase-like domain
MARRAPELPVRPDQRPPRWHGPTFPQQIHLELRDEDINEAEPEVLALGATPQPSEPGLRVYADPAGYPFCLEWE